MGRPATNSLTVFFNKGSFLCWLKMFCENIFGSAKACTNTVHKQVDSFKIQKL